MTLADIKALEKMATSLGQTRSQCIREILKTALAKRTT
jgi:metal-responsive CopG/Arc/MetJ family transcriptional regulator